MATTSTARSFSKERHEHRRRRDHLHGTTIHAQHRLRVPALGSRCRRTPSSQGGRHLRAAHACAHIADLTEQSTRTPTSLPTSSMIIHNTIHNTIRSTIHSTGYIHSTTFAAISMTSMCSNTSTAISTISMASLRPSRQFRRPDEGSSRARSDTAEMCVRMRVCNEGSSRARSGTAEMCVRCVCADEGSRERIIIAGRVAQWSCVPRMHVSPTAEPHTNTHTFICSTLAAHLAAH